ncbi:MAG: leucyl aminopeptidase [Bacteroidota bacterium]
MKVSVTTLSIAELDVELLLIPVSESHIEAARLNLAEAFGDVIQRAAPDFDGKAEEQVVLYPEKSRAKRIALLGLGPWESVDNETLRSAASAGATLAYKLKVETAACMLPAGALDVDTATQALVEGFVLGSYRFATYKTDEKDKRPGPMRLVLHAQDQEKACRAGAERGRVIAESVISARDLVNTSPNEQTATLLGKAIERSAKKHGYEADVWDKALIEEEKMGGILAVNLGSVEPPTFSMLTWKPENSVNDKPIVLVGKGVVYDTGGLSLKPTKGSMDYMKSDMGGAAAVIGAMEAIARLALPLHVIGMVPATDNRPGVNAYVPGDVIRMHSGKTVEVLNTDAEGRMLLADALSYAQTYKPALVFDLATLTGGAVVALGRTAAAVMTNETEGAAERIEAIEAAGRESGDLVHRLPMFAAYGDQLKSNVADIKNVGGREASSITAGKFLEHFVDYPWIHVDIAGPAFLHEPKPYRPYGGTGFGVRLLVEFLRNYASPRKKK